MKRLGLYILLACFIMACQKEDAIDLRIKHNNLYAIQDDPSDSIQHKRFELYEKYGVAIFFNDTIGKVFVKTDINGDSVFQYETLDLNWGFSETNSGSVTYQVKQMNDPAARMKALRFAEVFLKETQPALYPYAMWLAESCYQISSAGLEEKSMVSRYRNLLFSGIEDINENNMLSVAKEYRNDLIGIKIRNYSAQLEEFNEVTEKRYYNTLWMSIFPDEILPAYNTVWHAIALREEWEGIYTFRNAAKDPYYELNWTDEQVDEYIVYSRNLVGKVGFLTYDFGGLGQRYTPRNVDKDLDLYIIEMLKYPRAEFLKRWEACPLVLKKYEILYAIIRDELGVEL